METKRLLEVKLRENERATEIFQTLKLLKFLAHNKKMEKLLRFKSQIDKISQN